MRVFYVLKGLLQETMFHWVWCSCGFGGMIHSRRKNRRTVQRSR